MKKMSQSKQHSLRMGCTKPSKLPSALSGEEQPEQPKQTGTIMNYPIFTCFTDYDAARVLIQEWDTSKNVCANLQKSGISMWKPADQSQGDIGGELYRNEVETLSKPFKAISLIHTRENP